MGRVLTRLRPTHRLLGRPIPLCLAGHPVLISSQQLPFSALCERPMSRVTSTSRARQWLLAVLQNRTMLGMMTLQGRPRGLRQMTRMCGNQPVLGVTWFVLLYLGCVLQGVMLSLCRKGHEYGIRTLQDLDRMLLLGRIGI